MPPPIVSVATADGATVDVTVVEATAPAVPAGATRVTPVSAEDIAAAQAAAKAAVDAERRSLAAKRAAYTKRRNLSRPHYAEALEDPVIRGRLIALADPSVFAGDFLVYPKDSPARAVAKAFVETFCSPLDAKLSALVAANPSAARTALRVSLFNPRVKDQGLRAAIAGKVGLKPENKAVEECLIRLVMQARAHGREWHDAKRRPLVGPSSSRWRKRLAGMREAAKAAEEPKVLHPRAAAQGFTVPALDRTAPTFPGITRTVKVWSSSPLGLLCETAEGKKVFVKRDEALDPTKQTGRFAVRKPGDAPNLLDSFRATVDDRELRSGLVAFSLHPCLDNGKVRPADWWWLLRRSMLSDFVGQLFFAHEKGEPVVGPEWAMVRRADVAPVVLPQVASLVLRLFPGGDATKALSRHVPKSHVDPLVGAVVGARIAQPSGLAIHDDETPEKALERMMKDPEASECEDGVNALDVNAFLLRDSGTSWVIDAPAANTKLTFAGYAEKFGLDVAREAYQADMLKRFRSARGLSVVVLDPSEYPAIAYRVFTYDESRAAGIWAVQPGNEGLQYDHRGLKFNVQWAAQSCMRYPNKAERSVSFYAHHTTAKLALVVDRSGRIHARALLWTEGLDLLRGVKLPPVLDRIYMTSRRAMTTLADHAIDNGWIAAMSVTGDLGVFPLFGLANKAVHHGGAYLDTVSTFATVDSLAGYSDGSRFTVSALHIGESIREHANRLLLARYPGGRSDRLTYSGGSLPSPDGGGISGGDYAPTQHLVNGRPAVLSPSSLSDFFSGVTPVYRGYMHPPSSTRAAGTGRATLAEMSSSPPVAASSYHTAVDPDTGASHEGTYYPVFDGCKWGVRKLQRSDLVRMAEEGGWKYACRTYSCPVFFRASDESRAIAECPASKSRYLSGYLGADEGDLWNPASIRVGGKVAVSLPASVSALPSMPSGGWFLVLPKPPAEGYENPTNYAAMRAKLRELASE